MTLRASFLPLFFVLCLVATGCVDKPDPVGVDAGTTDTNETDAGDAGQTQMRNWRTGAKTRCVMMESLARRTLATH